MVFGNEEMTTEQRVKAIMTEHKADERGLVNKRDELFVANKEFKGKVQSYKTSKAEYETKISKLEDELKKNSPEEHRKYYASQLESKQKELDAVQ